MANKKDLSNAGKLLKAKLTPKKVKGVAGQDLALSKKTSKRKK
jgi:hypothetical protein